MMPAKKEDIRVVMLDVDNTLLDFKLCAHACAEIAAKQFGITLPENLDEVFHRINDGLWLELEKGNLTIDDIHAVRWKKVFTALGMEEAAKIGPEFEGVFVEELKYQAIPVKGAMELLNYLKEKYVLCVGSNGPWEQQHRRLMDAGMLEIIGEENLFTSGEIGFSKPQKPFFEVCLERLNKQIPVTPSQMVMIGDSLSADINGAYDFGLTTIWFDYKKEGREADKEGKVHIYVDDLDQIKNYL